VRLERVALAIAAAGLAAVAGCGEKRDVTGTGASGANAPARATVSVSETEFKLTPSTAKVAKPGVVTIHVTNAGKTAHALVVVTPKGEVKVPPIQPGGNATLNADLKAGTYTWYCPIDGHKAKGMKGQIVVGSGSGGSSSGGGSSGGGYSRGGGY
jgi:uncharacterized cupredoxin-like copper-binding protein